MIFEELLNLVSSGPGPEIRADSRLVRPGDIFVALKGTCCDGHDFIDQALANGAKYIICQQDTQYAIRNTQYEIIVEDTAQAAGLLAQGSRGNPCSQLTNLAVTGTNGKTTVAYLVRSIIQRAGQKCGLVGTVIYDTCSGKADESALTTPDCLAIAEMTEKMVQNGAKYMVTEASSHALSQNRLAGINFKAAAFTNLAGDHLDYHKTKEDYLAAKARLFQTLSPDATAVLNKQSTEAKLIASKTAAKIVWYTIDPAQYAIRNTQYAIRNTNIIAHIESMSTSETVFTLEYHGTRNTGHRTRVKTPLLGLYNVSNCLAAAGLCLAAGFDIETIAAGVSALQTIPGRLEKIDWEKLTTDNAETAEEITTSPKRKRRDKSPPSRSGLAASSAVKQGDFSVLVDYAHTDDALKNVLATLKPLCKGNLLVVFGCGGDRDRTKRPRMAKVAEQLADFIIVTSDNPRTEQPEDIIDEIVAGFEKGPYIQSDQIRHTTYNIRHTKVIEPDRRKAIKLAIKTARKDDIVLIAGKGHETYQVIGTKKFDFSDKKIAEEYLKERIRNAGLN